LQKKNVILFHVSQQVTFRFHMWVIRNWYCSRGFYVSN